VEKFPTLIVVTTSGEKITYEGQLKHEALFTFLSKYAKKIERQSSEGGSSKSGSTTAAPQLTRNVLEEVTDDELFEKLCAVNCLVSVFDPLNAPDLQETYLKTLEDVSTKNKKYFNFLWIDASKQTDFVNELHLHSGFPAVVVLNQKKMSVIPFIGSYTDEKLNDFIESILAGKRASKLDKFPHLSSHKKESKESKEL
jgi:hypothetical protein